MDPYQASVRDTMSGSTKPATERALRLGLLLGWSLSLCGCVASVPEARLRIDSGEAEPVIRSFQDRFDPVDHIIAPVMINGHGPYRFMIDTGANRTVLAQSLVQRLGLAFDGENPVSLQGVIGNITVTTAHVDTLRSGAMHMENAFLPVMTGPVLQGLDGILGMDGFEGTRMSANFVRNELTISQSRGRLAAPKYSIVPVRFISQRVLVVDALIAGVRVKAVIDTGGSRTLGNPALLAALNLTQAEQQLARPTHVVDATEALQRGRRQRVPFVHVGGITIANLEVAFAGFRVFDTWGLNDQPALLIGMDVLGSLAELNIDYRLGLLEMLPRPYKMVAAKAPPDL
jgi:predicted aspartyl protease